MQSEYSFEGALRESFFMRPTEIVARELIGATLVRLSVARERPLAARIVETEAYLSEGDEASHSFRGKTPRNAPMFAMGGRLYVYQIYGVHLCSNIVTEEEGRGCAVLIRALEPLAGIEAMSERRPNVAREALCRGPGNAAKAFGFTLADNQSSVSSAGLFILPPVLRQDETVGVSARVGISKAVELPLRFFIAGNRSVSRRR